MARKILLADDSVTAQNMGRKILADAGYEVITVNNGSAALKKIAEQKPDLIVLDVYMPGYSGLEVCQRLKEVHETSRIPVVLTVGKLEPFKPEEARRVRADGFIVKPFEASELLSALTKLEDKIVPRPEASKPGRFARAIAAVEDGHYDKSVAIEEDSGWKNRIAFPSKKKEKAAEQEDGDDPAIYNAVNKDLRTVVDHQPAHRPQQKPEDARVDLGALAPEGLPKDVTPEEIAALAAAAAQVKGKIAESKVDESKPEARHDAQSAAELSKDITASDSAATFTTQKSDTETRDKETPDKSGTPADAANGPAGVTAPSPSDGMAAISTLEPVATQAANSANGSASHIAAEHITPSPADEPVTMAVAAGAESAFTASRWTAVSVALAPEEAALSLEHEMHKAYAAFAAADAHAEPVERITETQPAAPEPVTESVRPPVAPAEPVATVEPASYEAKGVEAALEPVVQATPLQEVAHAIGEMASAAADSIRAAVKEFETVTASHIVAHSDVPSEPEQSPAQSAAAPAPEALPAIEARIEENPGVAQDAPQEPVVAQEIAPPALHEEPKHEDSKVGERGIADPPAAAEETSAITTAETTPQQLKTLEPMVAKEVSADHLSADQPSPGQSSANQAEENAPTAEPAMPAEPVPGGRGAVAKKESEIAETTAAAWASWRRIRESGDARSTTPPSTKPQEQPTQDQPKEDAPVPQDNAAMAVAAGAENAPEEMPSPSDQDSGEIASIVDSVLADMRPRIVEEISRKLKKKK